MKTFSNQDDAIAFARKHWIENGERAWVVAFTSYNQKLKNGGTKKGDKRPSILSSETLYQVHFTPPALQKGRQIIFRAGE